MEFDKSTERARRIEKNHNKMGRGADAATPKRKLGISTKNNPTSKTGIKTARGSARQS